LIDPLAFIPPAELAPDAAIETTLDALKSKFDTPLVFDKAGLATITGQAAIAHAIADKPPTDVSALAKDTTLGQLKTSLEFAGWGEVRSPPAQAQQTPKLCEWRNRSTIF
jgi:hypothetical protein